MCQKCFQNFVPSELTFTFTSGRAAEPDGGGDGEGAQEAVEAAASGRRRGKEEEEQLIVEKGQQRQQRHRGGQGKLVAHCQLRQLRQRIELVPRGGLVNQSSVISCADYLFMNGLLRLTSFSESG